MWDSNVVLADFDSFNRYPDMSTSVQEAVCARDRELAPLLDVGGKLHMIILFWPTPGPAGPCPENSLFAWYARC